MTDFDPEIPSKRIYALEGNNKLYVERKDPYGLIYIHFEKGEVPESLKGAFTDYDSADKAIQLYLSNRKRIIKEVVET